MERKGICQNKGFCTLAFGEPQVITNDGDAFVCTECGEELKLVVENYIYVKHPKKKPWKLILIIIAVLLLGVGGYFGYKFFFCRKGIEPNTIGVENIILNREFLELQVGDTFQLKKTIFPDSASEELKRTEWTSSADSIATVDSTGLVTAHADGTAIILAITESGLSRTCSVTVGKNPFTIPPKDGLSKKSNENITSSTSSQVATYYSDKQLNTILSTNAELFLKIVGDVPVVGVENIENSLALTHDVLNGSRYSIRIERNSNGKITKIIVQ